MKKLVLILSVLLSLTIMLCACTPNDIGFLPKSESSSTVSVKSATALTSTSPKTSVQDTVSAGSGNGNSSVNSGKQSTTQSSSKMNSTTDSQTSSSATGGGSENPTPSPVSENPKIYLTTSTGKDVTSKEVYINGTFKSVKADGTTDINTAEIEIRGRGNTTWTFEKKAYRIKFSSKKNPFGLSSGTDKSWILLANMCDHSLIRNQLGFTFAESLDNIAYTPNIKAVDVYLNGEYRGAYLLTEAINDGKGRIDYLEQEPDKVEENGYLFELSKNKAPTDTTSIMITDKRGNPYEVDDDVLSTKSSVQTQQKTYLTNYINSCIDAVEGKNQATVAGLIDVNSAVDTYILEETLNNMDVGWDSFYFTKNADGKMVFGPVWDFDVTMGNGDDLSQYATGFRAAHAIESGALNTTHDNYWFVKLMECQWFRQKVAARWNQLDSNLNALVSNVTTFANAQKNANKLDFAKWSTITSGKLDKINFENEDILNATTYEAQIAFLKTWLETRIAWLDDQFNSAAFISGTLPKYSAN